MKNVLFGLRSKSGMTIKKWNNKSRLILPAIIVGAVLILGGGTISVLAALGIISPTSVTYVAPPAHTTMQTFTSGDCSAMGTYTTLTITDSRADNKQYRVRKMPDGHCWMIDNLKLGGTGSPITLTSANTNIKTNPGGQTSFVLPANPIVNATTKLSNGRCDASGLTNTSGAYLTCKGASPTAPAVTTVKTDQPDDDLRFAGYVDPADALNTGQGENCAHGAPGLDPNSLTDCGYLYNWYTATAGIGNYTWPADTTANANATTSDICPAGWHLPKAGNGSTTGNEFATVNAAMYNGSLTSSTASEAAYRSNWAANGPFAGTYSGSWGNRFGSQGYGGYYWSSSASSATNARILAFDYTNAIFPGNNSGNKYSGLSVRCVL